MSSDALRVHAAELATAAKAASDAATEVGRRRDTLDSRVDSLRGTWTGRAGAAYLDVWEEVSDECAQMLADLRWIGESLAASAWAYEEMDQSNRETLTFSPPAGFGTV